MNKDYLQNFQKENDNYLKNTFGGWIKQIFLITVKNTFLNNPLYSNKILEKFHLFDLSIEHYIHRHNDLEFEVCQFIVMLHLHNTFSLSESDIGKLQKDDAYISKLCSQVYKAIVVKDYSLSHLTSNSIFGYYPLAYYCGVMTNYLSDCLNDKIAKNEQTKIYNKAIFYPSFSKILTKSMAICVLINANLFEETFGFLRYIIETFAIFVAISGHEDAIKYHNKLAQYRSQRAATGQYPKEFLDDCERYNIDSRLRSSFINYGWLTFIPLFKGGKYTFDSVLAVIPPDSEILIHLKRYLGEQYKKCGTFVHSNTIRHESCPVMLTILQNTAYLLDIASEFFSNEFGLQFEIDGVNLKEQFRSFYYEAQYTDDDIKKSKAAKRINDLFMHHTFINK